MYGSCLNCSGMCTLQHENQFKIKIHLIYKIVNNLGS
uniref:Uncharacterized protein n=1 Tax=Anguilla anguilla TaxID=7936 RepID=A0A0E9UNG6_ANGAN